MTVREATASVRLEGLAPCALARGILAEVTAGRLSLDAAITLARGHYGRGGTAARGPSC